LFQTSHLLMSRAQYGALPTGQLCSTAVSDRPLACGPFRVAEWQVGQRLVLTRSANPGAGRLPKFERIVFLVVKDYQTRLQHLLKSTVQLIEAVEADDLARVRQADHLRLLPQGRRLIEFLSWNLTDPLFQDASVRRAMTMAIDRQQLLRVLLSDSEGHVHGCEAVGTFSPELHGFASGAGRVVPLEWDPAAAGDLLSGAGWTLDPQGRRVRDGRVFRFKLMLAVGNRRRLQGAQLIKDHLQGVGVEVEIEPVDHVELRSALGNRTYQAAYLGFTAPLSFDQRPAWHSASNTVFNASGYQNPQVDAQIELAMSEPDTERALPLWHELERMIYQDQPWTFLYWLDRVTAIDRRIQGVTANPLSLLYRVEEWWPEPRSK
jgi:peptide/nickel transport system substrate-binding protein